MNTQTAQWQFGHEFDRRLADINVTQLSRRNMRVSPIFYIHIHEFDKTDETVMVTKVPNQCALSLIYQTNFDTYLKMEII